MCDMITITIMITVMSAILFYRVKKKHCCDAMFLCVYIVSSFLSCVVWFHFILYCFEWFNLCVCRKYRFVHSKVFGKKRRKDNKQNKTRKKGTFGFTFWPSDGRMDAGTRFCNQNTARNTSRSDTCTHMQDAPWERILSVYFSVLYSRCTN